MEDQKTKKSIAYLLQGLAGNSRNEVNWQVQGYLHLTLKTLRKSYTLYSVYKHTHLRLDLKMILILFLIGFINITPSLTTGHANPFLVSTVSLLISCKQRRDNLHTLYYAETRGNIQAF